MSEGIVTASYVGATILFILSVGRIEQSGNRKARQPFWDDRHGCGSASPRFLL